MQLRFLLLILVFYSAEFVVQVFSKFLIKSIKSCDSNADYPIQINLTFRTVRGLQYLDSSGILRVPLDNTLKVNMDVEMLVGKHYVHLFTVREKRACDTVHKLLGEFFYEVERNAGVIPGLCPIREGKYGVHNMALHFERMSMLQTVPFGKIRAIASIMDPKNNYVCCWISDVENNL